MATPCDKVQIKYKGNGTQKLFTFPFTYIHPKDVFVGIWDDKIKDYTTLANDKWSFANATTVEFVNAPLAPPPPVDSDPEVFNILIFRETDVSAMDAVFYPGSAIRAQDLNDDFDQLRLAIEDGRCHIPGQVYKYLSDNYWNKTTETIDSKEQGLGQWISDDRHVATTKAISDRLDPFIQDTKPPAPSIVNQRHAGKFWVDDGVLQLNYWEPAANAWVNLANTGPMGPVGPVGPMGSYKTIVSPTQPTKRADGTPIQEGDVWFNTNNGTVYAWYNDGDSSQWISVTKTGPVGPVGPAGPTGTTGTYRTLISATQPSNRADGTPIQAGDVWFNTNNGTVYAWYDDGDSSQWISVTKTGPAGPASTVPGPSGPPGPQGPQGPQGADAYFVMTGHAPITATPVGADYDISFDPIPLTNLP